MITAHRLANTFNLAYLDACWLRDRTVGVRPNNIESVLEQANTLMHGQGVASITDAYAWAYGCAHGNAIAIYVNMGNPDAVTLLHDVKTHTYTITSWKAWYQKWLANRRDITHLIAPQ